MTTCFHELISNGTFADLCCFSKKLYKLLALVVAINVNSIGTRNISNQLGVVSIPSRRIGRAVQTTTNNNNNNRVDVALIAIDWKK